MSTHNAPEVVLVDGDEASGMASMLAGLLADNVRDFPGRARVAARARGSVVLRAADRKVDVTLSFDKGRVEVRNGAESGVTIVAGPWLAMARLCSGQLSPVKAVRGGELEITPGRHLPAAAVAGYVLSVPESFYEQAGGEGGSKPGAMPSRTTLIAVGVGGVVVIGVTAILISRRRRRRRRQG